MCRHRGGRVHVRGEVLKMVFNIKDVGRRRCALIPGGRDSRIDWEMFGVCFEDLRFGDGWAAMLRGRSIDPFRAAWSASRTCESIIVFMDWRLTTRIATLPTVY